MTDFPGPWLQPPCQESDWKWRVYGSGVVWDHGQEWQALIKLRCLQASVNTEKTNVTRHDPELP